MNNIPTIKAEQVENIIRILVDEEYVIKNWNNTTMAARKMIIAILSIFAIPYKLKWVLW